ncbi:MAG TPA: STAS/SEC14 domain-containing protein [Phototrophicaceae bacterium]|nr:STAS/SEC14 domain-containing protein [Phototrophicaceae bacterium]
MSCQVYWIETASILGIDCSGVVTADDLKAVVRDSVAALAVQPVYFLIDVSRMEALPVDFLGTRAFSEWVYHPNARWFAYVGASSLLQSLTQVRHRNTAQYFKERETALAFLYSAIGYGVS